MTKILNGKIVADKIIRELIADIDDLKASGVTPHLAAISVGDNGASQKYLAAKQARVEGLGLEFNLYEFLPIATANQVEELIEQLNDSHSVDGILVQLPLPQQFNREEVLAKINPEKDVDNLTGNSDFISPTAQAILEILRFYKISISGKKVVVVGKGKLVGEPFAKLAKSHGAIITVVDSKTKNLKKIIQAAEVLVTGVGQPKLITADIVQKDVCIIDAGIFVEKGAQQGDADFSSVSNKVAAITPPTGGVGPVTIACLIRNLVLAAKNRQKA